MPILPVVTALLLALPAVRILFPGAAMHQSLASPQPLEKEETDRFVGCTATTASHLSIIAAGFFARRFLRHNDEWHVRMRQPLAAEKVAAWEFAADARIGGADNMLSIGYFRELHGKSGATVIWRWEL